MDIKFLRNRLCKVIQKLWEQIFPIRCVWCKMSGELICRTCMKKIIVHPEICPSCHKHSNCGKICSDCKGRYPDLDGIMIAFNYSTLVKKLILSLKYYHIYGISDFFAQKLSLLCLCNYLLFQNIEYNQILITAVPSHRYRRYFIKGYNQSELLAKACASQLWVNYQTLVKKSKNTSSQASLDRKKRLTNLHGSFKLASPLTNSIKTVIVIDNLTTTGSTLQEIAQCIKNSYPHVRVRWAVVARSNK